MSYNMCKKNFTPPEKCKINTNNCYLCAIEKLKIIYYEKVINVIRFSCYAFRCFKLFTSW